MEFCPNPNCVNLQRYGSRAELPEGTRNCPACGAPSGQRTPGEPGYLSLVAVARFGDPHAAHLARGRLEAEGIIARVRGEHLASMAAIASESGGLIRLEVAPYDVDRALAILHDPTGAMPETIDAEPETAEGLRICPRCGSAAVEEAGRRESGRFIARIRVVLGRLWGRTWACLTCSHRWR